MAEEIIDVYDEKMHLLGQATRSQAHQEGLWHMSFHCWIVRRSPEGRPQVLLQVRGKTQNHPSLIDISAAGHLLSGETPHDGIKSIEQELGLKVDFAKLTKLFTANHVFQKDGYINHEFNPTYLLEDSTPLLDYKLNPDRVEGLFIADVEDMLNLFKHKVEIFAVALTLTVAGYPLLLQRHIGRRRMQKTAQFRVGAQSHDELGIRLVHKTNVQPVAFFAEIIVQVSHCCCL